MEEEPIEETEATRKCRHRRDHHGHGRCHQRTSLATGRVFRRQFKDKSEAEAAELHGKFQKLGDSMIDSLVESRGASSVDTVKRIRIVQIARLYQTRRSSPSES